MSAWSMGFFVLQGAGLTATVLGIMAIRATGINKAGVMFAWSSFAFAACVTLLLFEKALTP